MKKNFHQRAIVSRGLENSPIDLSKKFDISDVGPRKLCLRLDIPLPRWVIGNNFSLAKR